MLKPCECGCGELVQRRFVSGHNNRGLTFSAEHRAKISVSSIGRQGSNLGRTFTAEHRARLSASQKGRVFSIEHRGKMSDAAIRKMLTSPGFWKDTKPEREFERQLQAGGLKYETQKRIGNMLVDFYLPQQNLVLEVDGCYYHGCLDHCPTSPWPNKFEIRKQRLEALGYDAIRIWEHEVMEESILSALE